MKRILSVIIVFAIVMTCFTFVCSASTTSVGKTVYADAVNGSDSYSGSSDKPYKTIAKAKENLSAGDTVVLRSGIYTEKIGGWQMNGVKDEPITFMGEKGADATVTTYEPINAEWQKYSGNIYCTTLDSYTDIAHALTYSGGKFSNMVEARWPDADPDYILDMPRAIAQSGTDNNRLCSSELPEGDYNGATVFTWTGNVYDQYVAYSRIINNYKAGESLEFSSRVPDAMNNENTYKPQNGDWYYITNSLYALNSEREYYFDKVSKKLYVITANGQMPKSNEIWVENRDFAVELWACNYVNFDNITFYGGVKLGDTNNCVLTNSKIYYADFFRDSDGYGTMNPTYNSTDVSGNGNVFRNCEIAYTMSTGILIRGNDTVVENCSIHDVNITGGYNSGITLNPNVSGTIIRRCEIYRSGRFLIYFSYDEENNTGYKNTLIEYNDLHHAMYLTQDGGLIYAYHRNGDGVTIRYNTVHDTDKKGSRGIYIDNNCYNFRIYRNVVYNIEEAGLVLNTQSENNLVYNNTILDCPVGIQVWPKYSDSSMLGTKIYNNIIAGAHDVILGSLAPEMGNNIFLGSGSYTDLLDENFVPKKGSSAIDKAISISGITDKYKGKAPDIGAYEYGADYWQSGIAVYGDVNSDGDVNSLDILALKKYIVKWETTISYKNTDVDLDSSCGLKDLLLIKKHIVGIKVSPWN